MLVRLHRIDVWLTICSIAIIGCSKQIMVSKTDSMVFLGHIYQTGKEDRIDFRIEDVKFDKFDVILLAGDLCVETTKNQKTLSYLDSIFDLSDPNTHWSLGNHDIRNGNVMWIEQTTNRPDFYTIDNNSLRITVLNTNLDDCTDMQLQFEMLVESLQPEEAISHHLIISHHAIWTAYLEEEGVITKANARHSIWQAYCPSQGSSFKEVIVPELLEARNNGMEVIWAAGDFGQKVSGFSHRTEEGIWYLGSGLAENGRISPDSIMTFTWDPASHSLVWQFTEVEEFAKKYK